MARWTPPPYGQVRLALGSKPPPWPPGTVLRPGKRPGSAVVSGVPRRGRDGRETLELRLRPGRHYLLALTVGRNVAVVGQATRGPAGRAGPRAWPPTGCTMTCGWRWVWPGGATDAVVRWPGGEHRCSRRVYDDEGGVTVTVGPTEAPSRSARSTRARAAGSPRRRRRSACPRGAWRCTTAIRRAGRWHPQRRIVELSAEQETRLPALIVVQTTGPYAPDDPAEGETVARIGPQPIAPGQPVTSPSR